MIAQRVPFVCRGCGNHIATIVRHDNAFVLDFGTCVATNFAGVCGKCHRPLYWNVNTQALQAVLADLGLGVSLEQLDNPIKPQGQK
jgi:hypothetical protein